MLNILKNELKTVEYWVPSWQCHEGTANGKWVNRPIVPFYVLPVGQNVRIASPSHFDRERYKRMNDL